MNGDWGREIEEIEKEVAKISKAIKKLEKAVQGRHRQVKAAECAISKGDKIMDCVLDAVGKSRTGANIADLKAKTNLEPRQLSNALYKLAKKGQLKTTKKGVYKKVK